MKTTKIYGPPGTGKTTTLISTLAKLLKSGYRPSEIAYLSHTKAATLEVRDRIVQQFDGYDLQRDFGWFRTIHSACCRVMSIGGHEIWGNRDTMQFSAETGWPCRGIMSMEELLDTIGGEVNYDVVLNARSNASNWMIPIEEAMARMPENPAFANAHAFLKQYEQAKQSAGKIDFTDMLEKVQGRGPLPVRAMLVDECQDLSKRQWEIIDEWSQGVEKLYLAGDDDQSIYAFMGGDEYGFLDHDADKEVILHNSYRCPQGIGETAEKIISRIDHRAEKEVIWKEDAGEVRRIADLDLVPWRDLANGDKSVMVLVRHRRQGSKISYGLLDLNIPHTIMGNGVTTTRRAKMIEVFLRMRQGAAFTGPQIADMLKSIGYTDAAREARRLAGQDRGGLFTRESFPDIPWDNQNWPALFAKNQRDRRAVNTLRRFINLYGLDIMGKELKIDISTYHASKGREADIVILVTDCFKIAWEEQIKKPTVETRLCYVGVTRAREKAYIVAPQTDMYLKALVEN